MNNEQPCLRPIEVFPVQDGGEDYLVLRDPDELSTGPLIISAVWGWFLSQLDGAHTVQQMRVDFEQQVPGMWVPEERIRDLVDTLDKALLLDNERSRRKLKHIQQDFLSLDTRPARHAGSAYPGEPEQLAAVTDGMLLADPAPLPDRPSGRLLGILVPHIDLRVGGPCYGQGYRVLRQSDPADLYVILGVAHYGGAEYFIATDKDFQTPLGNVETDRDLLTRWEQDVGHTVRNGELAHRMEHSIEFQLPFLQRVCTHDFKILPILCGGMEPLLAADVRPQEVQEIARLLEGLAAVLGADERRVQFIVSVDLAHVGPKFGDPEAVTDESAADVREKDQQLLHLAEAVDPEGLYQHLHADKNARRVDATVALHTFLTLIRSGSGTLLGYDQSRQVGTGSMVTFASMAFWDR